MPTIDSVAVLPLFSGLLMTYLWLPVAYLWLCYGFAMALLWLYHLYSLFVKGGVDRWLADEQELVLSGGRALTTHRVPASYPQRSSWLPCGQQLVSRRVAAGYRLHTGCRHREDGRKLTCCQIVDTGSAWTVLSPFYRDKPLVRTRLLYYPLRYVYLGVRAFYHLI